MEMIDSVLGIVVDDGGIDDKRLASFFQRDTIHRETTRETGDCAKQTLKCLRHVVRDPVFIDLYLPIRNFLPPETYHGDNRMLRVRKPGLAAQRNDRGIMYKTRNHSRASIRCNFGIRINHKQKLVEIRWNTNDVSNLIIKLQFQRRHFGVEVNPIQEPHQNQLRVPFSAIARFNLPSDFLERKARCTTSLGLPTLTIQMNGTMWPRIS